MSDVLQHNIKEFVTARIEGQDFGLPVNLVRDIFMPSRITRVPECRPEVYGVLNLRGRIVTVIDMRQRLGLTPFETHEGDDPPMHIVIEHGEEPYSLMVDKVGDVMSLHQDSWEETPTTLDDRWASVADGIYRLEKKGLMVVLDIERVMSFLRKEAV